MFVIRSELSSTQKPVQYPIEPESFLLLRALEPPDRRVQFATYPSEVAVRTEDSEIYQLLVEVRGRWPVTPHYAVCAEWQLAAPENSALFEDSRRRLFELRSQVLQSFAFDWLLKRLDQDGRYLVLGVYGDEEGLRLCRSHPEIQRFAQAHPPDQYGATDVYGMHFFRIEQPSSL